MDENQSNDITETNAGGSVAVPETARERPEPGFLSYAWRWLLFLTLTSYLPFLLFRDAKHLQGGPIDTNTANLIALAVVTVVLSLLLPRLQRDGNRSAAAIVAAIYLPVLSLIGDLVYCVMLAAGTGLFLLLFWLIVNGLTALRDVKSMAQVGNAIAAASKKCHDFLTAVWP